MSYLVIMFVLYLAYKWVVSFRKLLIERGWIESNEEKIKEANKMLY